MRKYFFIGLGLAALTAYAVAQTVYNPAPSAAACVYNSSPPTGVSGAFIFVQCDSTGKLLVQ